ncbi:hypothetical protein COLO4_02895 [Corchorus olitorius]|uniref:Uncharacterized protein n=1 Tax=Corchorus olitorius TaxID=93759 RepID=A0A1R3L014_9ROSI|nr:hypothetical protein COLO4_02895 [Corchorus olitorius]
MAPRRCPMRGSNRCFCFLAAWIAEIVCRFMCCEAEF